MRSPQMVFIGLTSHNTLRPAATLYMMSSCRDGWPSSREILYTQSPICDLILSSKNIVQYSGDWISTWAQAALNFDSIDRFTYTHGPKVYVVEIISKSFTFFIKWVFLYRFNRVDVWNYMDLLQQLGSQPSACTAVYWITNSSSLPLSYRNWSQVAPGTTLPHEALRTEAQFAFLAVAVYSEKF